MHWTVENINGWSNHSETPERSGKCRVYSHSWIDQWNTSLENAESILTVEFKKFRTCTIPTCLHSSNPTTFSRIHNLLELLTPSCILFCKFFFISFSFWYLFTCLQLLLQCIPPPTHSPCTLLQIELVSFSRISLSFYFTDLNTLNHSSHIPHSFILSIVFISCASVLT